MTQRFALCANPLIIREIRAIRGFLAAKFTVIRRVRRERLFRTVCAKIRRANQSSVKGND
jgi:plasmid stabilization system protein ParE